MARQSKGVTLPIVYKADLKGLQDAENALGKFGAAIGKFALAAGAALAGVVVGGVKMAAEFETAFAKIEGLVGISGQQLDELREAAKRLGPETGRSAQDAADALFVIASAGLRGTDAINALELALKASTAGLGETEDIARAVAGAMNAYGSSVVDAARATDVIVATARAGNFETSQFAAAIGRVLPFAQQAGASLEDMGGAVALLTRTNGDAAQSVTQVAALFRAFVVPTEQAKKSLDRVGLSAKDLRDAIARDGLPQALTMLDEKLGGNREELGRLLGSSEAASAAFQILGADAQAIADTFGVVADSTGMTNEAFEVMEQTVGFKTTKAIETLKSIMLEIGDRILPLVTSALDNVLPRLIEIADAVTDFLDNDLATFISDLRENPKFQEFLTNVRDLLREMGPMAWELISAISNLAITLAPLLLEAINKVLPALKDMAGIIDNISFFIDEVVASFNLWGLETPAIYDWLEMQINPIQRLAEALRILRELLDAARVAYERFMAAGGISRWWNEGMPRSPGGGGRATGGSVMGGVAYTVGERGPEMFVPRTSGMIIPNHRLGGGASFNITVNAGLGANGTQLGAEIVSLIKRYERSSGPVFASA